MEVKSYKRIDQSVLTEKDIRFIRRKVLSEVSKHNLHEMNLSGLVDSVTNSVVKAIVQNDSILDKIITGVMGNMRGRELSIKIK